MSLSKKIIGLVSLVLVSGMFWQTGVSAAVINHSHVPTVLLKSERAVVKGQADRALSLLAGKIEDMKDASHRAQGHALVCQALYQKQDYINAEKSCDIAVKEGKPNQSHLNNRGVMRFMLGRYDEALRDFRKAVLIVSVDSPSLSKSVRRNLSAAERRVNSVL
jgi:Flp pilus assembly protein TadD